jgi:diaminopimelate epimerase
MEALGNDFLVLDARQEQVVETTRLPQLLPSWSDRHFGVGFDQCLILKPPRHAGSQVYMEVWNADGSGAEMCGNGLRAVAWILQMEERLPGVIESALDLHEATSFGGEFQISLRAPKILGDTKFTVLGRELTGIRVDVGNPHVVFLHWPEELTGDFAAWTELSRAIEKHPVFPEGTNVEWVRLKNAAGRSKGSAQVRVWERGAGWTLACGSGACAVFEAVRSLRPAEQELEVVLPGGALTIRSKESRILMKGPAREVFQGSLWIP